jgi:hypothetical protein
MVKRHVRVYIEGGAEGRTADSDFRRGWKTFLRELHELARVHGFHSLEVVRCKGRSNAFNRFKERHREHPNDLCVLLVDAEAAVPKNARVWDIVRNREGDRWQRPSWADESHLYLMVVFVETWLLTDLGALQRFFKNGFDPRSLPTTNLETRPKDEIERALRIATRDSTKGPYRHGQAHEIIGLVNPERVKTLSHGHRLFHGVGRLIAGEASQPD